MLAGLNLPISEDILLLTAGALAQTCLPEGGAVNLFIWVYLGAWVSAWEVYWTGRLLGPKLYEIRWFKHFVSRERIDRLHHYYEKFGIFTFIIGRFIPGGVRNALFLTAGLGKMPFGKFLLRDGPSCLISTTTLFSVGYTFAEFHEELLAYLKTYNLIILSIITGLITFFLVKSYWKRRKEKRIADHDNYS